MKTARKMKNVIVTADSQSGWSRTSRRMKSASLNGSTWFARDPSSNLGADVPQRGVHGLAGQHHGHGDRLTDHQGHHPGGV